eukprot:Lithocolla_globosa_v1_NODE_583_length_3681_cov_15.345284.p3 type:complete len:164 gc:universal NODE_583_length_3681_cov_15.345284:739-248(-)
MKIIARLWLRLHPLIRRPEETLSWCGKKLCQCISFMDNASNHVLRQECDMLNRVLAGISENEPENEPESMLDLYLLVSSAYATSFPVVLYLLKVALTLPVTTAKNERSFSVMKLVKSFLRNSMSDDRLSHLGVLSINKERAKKLDLDKVVERFARKKARRIPL